MVHAKSATIGHRPTLSLDYLVPVSFTRREIWEGQFYLPGTPLDPLGDDDSDGIATLLEYAWDLNPNTRQNPSDYFEVDFNVPAGHGQRQLPPGSTGHRSSLCVGDFRQSNNVDGGRHLDRWCRSDRAGIRL